MCGKKIAVIVHMQSELLKTSALEQYPGLDLSKLMSEAFFSLFLCLF